MNNELTIASFLYKIQWRKRMRGDVGNDCLVTTDGTDFMVAHGGRAFYSHKFDKSGL